VAEAEVYRAHKKGLAGYAFSHANWAALPADLIHVSAAAPFTALRMPAQGLRLASA